MSGMDVVALAKHLPRAYQEEIFARAQNSNIIAALDTGSGKTFIGALLIKWISAQETSNRKKIVFLVPKVPLVEQQSRFLAEQTPLSVKGYYGAMNVDAWDKLRWHREFSQADVLVMTAQIFHNIITHGFWRMDQISLLVFDECHHAQKNHPYNAIMNENYKRCPKDHRPKIFGMTASPIWNPNKPLESLRDLESNLSAKVLAVRENIDELANHSPRPIETVKSYSSSPSSYPAYPCPTLWDHLDGANLLNIFDQHLESLKARYTATREAIGPYGADYFLHSHFSLKLQAFLVRSHEERLKKRSFTLYNGDIMKNDEIGSVSTIISTVLPIRNAIDQLQHILAQFELCLSIDFQIPPGWLSPKLEAVVDILREYNSTSFQGILFVEQRQVASVMSWMLPRLPQLKNWLRCADLMGHGVGNGDNTSMKGMALKSQEHTVQLFREGSLNLLVATSVAEEGLDFPACELVIRFDGIQHMVGYVQSRGRARHRNSAFVIMIEENNALELARYKRYKESEPELKLIYQGGSEESLPDDADNCQDDPNDLAEREVYIVPSTGAILTYSSSISMLSHLCSLIPRDGYTAMHRPRYHGDFEVRLELPSALPLARGDLLYQGPPKRTKKEAKRAAAFLAVKVLHYLGVFDDYLSPVKAIKGEDLEDADGRRIAAVGEVPENMLVHVRDPWRAGPSWWLHGVYLDGCLSGGLVTGTQLPPVDLIADGTTVILKEACPIAFSTWEKDEQIALMEKFTKMGIWWCVTGRPIDLPLSCFLVPIDLTCAQPDWETMHRAIANTGGTYNWDGINDSYANRLMVVNSKRHGQPLLLRRIRHDLTPLSKPKGENDDGQLNFETYADYFVEKFSDGRFTAIRPTHGPLLEVSKLPRQYSALYHLKSRPILIGESGAKSLPVFLVPQAYCKWVYLPQDVYRTFHVLPQLCHRVTDICRVRSACKELKLPPITDDLLIEAFTLPCALAGFNNQRLETLGDSVLKLCVVTYLYNKYPHKHEGQLDCLKKNSISNRVLLARAREVGLEHFLTSETQSLRIWRYATDQFAEPSPSDELPSVQRKFTRRSLQDCMEASLGASFLTGGLEMALHTGTALGLCFGGPVPWPLRYERAERSTPAPLFSTLQASLGYSFRNGELLLEAVTHPSFQSSTVSCYQRLEYLGDALIDLVVVKYLYDKFPKATSGQMSWARSRAVCAPALAAVAVKRLSLQKYMLANNVELSKAIAEHIPSLTIVTYEDIVKKGWEFDPPKVISDILESVLGAVFVDSGYDFHAASAVTRSILQDVLDILTPQLPRDPVSELMVWTAKAGCCRVKFQKSRSNPLVNRNDSMSVLVHDEVLVGPVTAASLSKAKGLASAKALSMLSDAASDRALSCLCDCRKIKDLDVLASVDAREKDLNDETEEGFTCTAQIRLDEVTKSEDLKTMEDEMRHEEEEVETMIQGGPDEISAGRMPT